MDKKIEKIMRKRMGDFFVIVDGGAKNGTNEIPNLHPLSVIFAFGPNRNEFEKLKLIQPGDHKNNLRPSKVINSDCESFDVARTTRRLSAQNMHV